MELFYSPDLELTLQLPEEESRHCVKVLRHVVGDVISVIDGCGGLYEVEIVEAHQKRTSVKILSKQEDFGNMPYRLHIAVAPTKNIDRFEWFVEKATEIYCSELTPLLCRYSERKIVKGERVEKILLSAAKQSLKASVPVLHEMTEAKKFIAEVDCKHKFIAHCYDDIEKEHLMAVCPKGEPVVIMVGPEGDFSREEVELALENGFKSVSLGTSRLRTETAGVVAVNIVNLKNM